MTSGYLKRPLRKRVLNMTAGGWPERCNTALANARKLTEST